MGCKIGKRDVFGWNKEVKEEKSQKKDAQKAMCMNSAEEDEIMKNKAKKAVSRQ